MRKVFERIAKSLENIVELLKTQAQERAELKEKFDTFEKMLTDLRNNPFGIKEKE
ncbi:hypothetical protein [Streptococcus suis]|uniref:hypothetical protein n=1 Tax=Streptococcus suis TaxID=1307 RepID=UPI0002B788F8|nr:hypothetical protein [Streptococcus suis]AGF87399.1 hypothetical protein phi30c_0055 [Streptococcus phage phi30c]QBX20978.1 hypothetical protein Javan549_0051 [Streptococcus phage Javan549]MCQ8272796.1 hypothetical protein [Streptococcus suis]MDY7601261.1 hypothetical protein [Streptococcus suis]NQK32059.1 hypothetical protein [Streptococcus suis]